MTTAWSSDDATPLNRSSASSARPDRLLAEGHDIPEVATQLEVSEATYHRWRAQYGGLKADDVRRLKELEGENARLKRLLTEAELERMPCGSWPRETSDSRPSLTGTAPFEPSCER